MNPNSELDRYTLEQLGRIHEQARQRADSLRRQAMDELWLDFADEWSTRMQRSRRAAARLASSLARHARLRSTAATRPCPEGC